MNLFKAPIALVRAASRAAAAPPAVERLLAGAPAAAADAAAVVIDARGATSLDALRWAHDAAQRHAKSPAFRASGGRVIVVRDGAHRAASPEAAAVSEGLVGWAKSLAKENGARGATVNLLRDDSLGGGDDACAGALEWLASHESRYVTGQELAVSAEAMAMAPAAAGGGGARLVTGAARGIGQAVARRLAQDGEPLVLVDHPSSADALAAVAEALGATALPLDIASEGAAAAVCEAARAAGGLAAVVHAAGITRDRTLARMSADEFDSVLDVNLRGPAAVDAALLAGDEHGLLAGRAAFVYFGSTSGIAGNAGQTNYAASKAGLMGYARRIAADRGNDHLFSVVAPGFIETDMTKKMPFVVRTLGAKLNALGQAGQVDDVAEATAFLAAGPARNRGLVSGQTLRVCGMFMGGR